jgi:hypothetical protein
MEVDFVSVRAQAIHKDQLAGSCGLYVFIIKHLEITDANRLQ